MKKYFILLTFLILLIVSCEKSEQINNVDASTISILYPENNSEITCEECTIEIITIIENKESSDLAYILVNDNIIASGLLDTLRAYYQPPSDWNQTINIEARLVNFLEDNSLEITASDNNVVNINSIDIDPLTIDPIFMNVNNQFSMMRFPVTNRDFINFLNVNQYLEVEVVDVFWDDENGNNYGDPLLCHERDPGDQYEPTEWWYVNVKAVFGNQDIPSGEYTVYKNGYNIYDTNADYSNQGGKIQYDCQTQTFFLPNEQDGSESIYLDHPVTGVSWIGATIYANHFGWSLPSMEQWEIAAKDINNWNYPWGNTINTNYANYNNISTSKVGFYNGLGELNLSLSALGLYDMAGNVWEHTLTSSVPEIYFKTGGAFDSDTTQLQIGYTGYAIFDQVSNNTGFRCITNINYPSSPASGCMEDDKCNFDIFAVEFQECFNDDCLEVCGGNATENQYFQDEDGDNLGNPNISETQCNEPQDGWCDNNNDLDDTCPSSDINQNNIDCNSVCNGDAYTDGCGDCVGGNTGQIECNEDCNGVNGGSAERDDCDVCAGGDTGLEPNQDLDCNGVCAPSTPQGEDDFNNGLDYGAYLDDCNDCVGGGTGFEENYADLGCGCDEPEIELYCLDTNGNNCCDCGNDDNGGWDECNSDIDAEFICEDQITDSHIETILGCSIDIAENWYCDDEDNQCINFFGTIIPPCNFIDDGSCVIYGCSDPLGQNYSEDATECEDGSIDNCCEYAEPIIPDVYISFGTFDEENIEILINNPEDDVSGFQFNIEGINISGGTGGLASEAGFAISANAQTVLGFSFSGTVIPQGSNGILTILDYESIDENACFYLGTGAISDGNGDELGVQFGNEPETDPDTIDSLDDCIQIP
jgi:formylglycine-generating enzyme required for sulfatase activity